MKISAACQGRLGTSFMIGTNIKQVLADLGADVNKFEVSHTDVGSVPSDMADYFLTEYFLKDTLASIPDEKLISLQSIIDNEEVEEKVTKILPKE